ncbi:MAG: hypothetical protein OEX09_05500 [Candidatus Bathyarchaeota archaeon]|nr:hypothetical protein [Candidatus Bathyarchaeota archaeon]
MLGKWLRKILTRTVVVQGDVHRKKAWRVQIPPSDKLVYGMYFAVIALLSLTALEFVHMIFFGVWNSEIFSAITGLIGTISGIFISQKA